MRTVVFCLLLVGILRNRGVEGTDEEDIRKRLLENYDKASLPNQLTNVTVRFTILDIDVDEVANGMILDAWVVLQWNDPRLTWDASQYPDVDRLAFEPDLIWQPDLKLYNSAQSRGLADRPSTLMLAFPDGKILHVPQGSFSVACSLNMTYWPHDVHNCSAKFGSWVHSGFAINLLPADDSPQVEFEINTRSASGNVLSRHAWEVLDSSLSRNEVVYPCCPEPYVDITLSLTIRRDAPGFAWTVKIPVFVLTVMTGVMFFVPHYLGFDSVGFGTLLLILQMLYLMYAGGIARHCPTHPPILIELIHCQMVLTLVSVIVIAFTIQITRPPHAVKLPAPLLRAASTLSYFLCLPGYRKLSVECAYQDSLSKSVKGEELSMTNERPVLKSWFSTSTVTDSTHADWLLFGAVLNRIFLIIYIIGLIVKAAAFCQFF